MAKYKFSKTFWKGIRQLLYYGVPLLVATLMKFYPEISSLTIGTILTWITNWLKNRNNK